MTANGTWSIGELARAAGVTVRTLRHYDEIGLLRAGERTATGHRRYTPEDLRRLYRVRALRGLGMSLAEIGGVLDSSRTDPAALREVLRAQLDQLTDQAASLGRLIEQVRALLARLDAGSLPDPDQFMTTLEMISVLDSYFTQEQLDGLAQRREALGQEAIEEIRGRWVEVVEQLLPHVAADTPVDDPRVRDLVARWDAVGAAFQPAGAVGEQAAAAARRMWRERGAELSRNLPWPAERLTALTAYLERARAAG